MEYAARRASVGLSRYDTCSRPCFSWQTCTDAGVVAAIVAAVVAAPVAIMVGIVTVGAGVRVTGATGRVASARVGRLTGARPKDDAQAAVNIARTSQ